ncbi:MAG: hypothetical protein R2838_23195 [Caldilineaceae bacterium]
MMVDGTNLMLWLWLVLALLAAVFAVLRRNAMWPITVAALVTAFAAALPLAIGWQLLTFLVIALLGGLLVRTVTSATQQRTVGDTLWRRARRGSGRHRDRAHRPCCNRAKPRTKSGMPIPESGQPISTAPWVQVLVRGDRVLVRPLPVRPSRQSRFDFDTLSSVDISCRWLWFVRMRSLTR